MPCALSDTGPNVSIDTITPTVVSMPMPVSEMKYRRSAMVSPSRKAPMIAPPISRIDHTVDSSPTENPDSTVVAAPVCEDSATSRTGLRVVDVKCSVSSWMPVARPRPMTTAQNGRRSSM